MRIRNDQVTLSIGLENVALLKDVAAREGLSTSALVRELVSSLADKGDRDD